MQRIFLKTLAAGYLAFLLWLTLCLFPSGNPPSNLVPFRSIIHDWREGGHSFVVNFLGNLGAFVPLGILLPLIRTRATRLWHATFMAATLSVAIEAAQYLTGRRVADIDDVLLNALGGALGYALVTLVEKYGPASARAWITRLSPDRSAT